MSTQVGADRPTQHAPEEAAPGSYRATYEASKAHGRVIGKGLHQEATAKLADIRERMSTREGRTALSHSLAKSANVSLGNFIKKHSARRGSFILRSMGMLAQHFLRDHIAKLGHDQHIFTKMNQLNRGEGGRLSHQDLRDIRDHAHTHGGAQAEAIHNHTTHELQRREIARTEVKRIIRQQEINQDEAIRSKRMSARSVEQRGFQKERHTAELQFGRQMKKEGLLGQPEVRIGRMNRNAIRDRVKIRAQTAQGVPLAAHPPPAHPFPGHSRAPKPPPPPPAAGNSTGVVKAKRAARQAAAAGKAPPSTQPKPTAVRKAAAKGMVAPTPKQEKAARAAKAPAKGASTSGGVKKHPIITGKTARGTLIVKFGTGTIKNMSQATYDKKYGKAAKNIKKLGRGRK